MLGAMMLAAGVTRIYIGTHMHSHAKTMVIVGGAVTALVGLLIIHRLADEHSYRHPRHAARDRPPLYRLRLGRASD